ncbi:MAG: hypothetical protein JWN67_5053 [Actinomycetia bacterium]|nr:hypothetical protein [Actinomycetes bacterium]
MNDQTSDDQPAGELAGPITGEAVGQLDAIVPSAAEQRSDAKGRVGNTVTQVGVPGAVVTIGTWAAQLGHVDLDPGPGTDLPTIVAAAFMVLLTWGMARWMNREGLRAG